MRVLVMRHGEAVDPYAAPEPHRHLTARGRRVSREVGVQLGARGLIPTQIYTSPLVRAVQTADMVADAVGYEAEILVHAHLVPGASTAAALEVLERHEAGDVILLVSHEPTVRTLVAHLSGLGGRFPGFRTSAVAVLEWADDAIRLESRFDPGAMTWRGADDLEP